MITSRKVSQVNVFAGSPWEVASVKSLLKAAYIVKHIRLKPGTMGDHTRLFSLCMILLKRSNL